MFNQPRSPRCRLGGGSDLAWLQAYSNDLGLNEARDVADVASTAVLEVADHDASHNTVRCEFLGRMLLEMLQMWVSDFIEKVNIHDDCI